MSRVTDAHIEARRKSILDAAVRVFASRGVATATMAEIAEEAGLSAGAIYRYFESKQDLASACFKEGAEQVADQWRHQAEISDNPRAAFGQIAQQSFDEILTPEAAQRTRLMLEGYLEATRSDAEAVRLAAKEEHDAIVRGLASVLALVQESGQLPRTFSTHHLAEALYSFWLGARISRMIDPTLDTNLQLQAVNALMDAAAQLAVPAR